MKVGRLRLFGDVVWRDGALGWCGAQSRCPTPIAAPDGLLVCSFFVLFCMVVAGY